MSDFQTKRQQRIERLQERAAQKHRAAASLHQQAHAMADVIPFGQPILVGHHSERADRNYRNRITSKFRQAFELDQYADELERRAAAAAANQAIFSDDPDAAEKLQDKIARLEHRQTLMTTANKFIRRSDRDALRELGFPDAQIAELLTPDYAGRVGFPDFTLKNNSANIRRLKQRLLELERRASETDSEQTLGSVRIADNVTENRVQIFFPDKPSDEIRTQLKAHGFKWAPSNRCWQAYRGSNAKYWAPRIVRAYLNLPQDAPAVDPDLQNEINALADEANTEA